MPRRFHNHSVKITKDINTQANMAPDGTNPRANIVYSNEPGRMPVGGYDTTRRRGLQVYTPAQIIAQTGRDFEGRMLTWGVELPYFFLTVTQRNDIMKLSSPVLGIVTSRMHRISSLDFNIAPIKHKEDLIVDELKAYAQIYKEYSNALEMRYLVVRARMVEKIREVLPDILPDLSNFNGALLRWKKVIHNNHLASGDEVTEWLMEPNNGTTWISYMKKVVYNLMIHGCEGTYKKVQDGKLENFDSLIGGTVYKMKAPYFSGVDGYVQIVAGYEPQVFFANEICFMEYIPTSTQNYSLIPLEALINKIAEGMLFDRLMAEQADGTKWPEKLVIVTDNTNPFGSFDEKQTIPLEPEEQRRLEMKLNEPRKGSIMTFSGNDVKMIDLTRENTMETQRMRQKDIREEVALVFNMSQVEANLPVGEGLNSKGANETQQEIEQGKGIVPILKLIENSLTKNILPFRYGYGLKLEFKHEKNLREEEEIDALRLQNGKVTMNELREKDNEPTFQGAQYDLPPSGGSQQPGSGAINPLYTKPLE